jgi:hypothetical protein
VPTVWAKELPAPFTTTNREILTFKSFNLGMGFFHFLPDENESYYAICMNEQGITRRFDLPNPNPDAMVVTAQMSGNYLQIIRNGNLNKMTENMSLLIHHKGDLVHPISPGVNPSPMLSMRFYIFRSV